MKLWIAASGITQDQWHSWIDITSQWFENVELHSVDIYDSETSSVAIFTYEYFKKSPYECTEQKIMNGAYYVDGWISGVIKDNAAVKGGKLYIHDNNRTFDPIQFSKCQGEFSYIEILPHQLILASDFYATKPLYYSISNQQLFASSDLRVLLINPEIQWSIDEQKTALFLSSFGSLGENEASSEETFFLNIKKLAPHHTLMFNGKEAVKQSYVNYQTNFADPYAKSSKNSCFTTHFKETLDQAVYNRVNGQTVSLMLSGGIDSSTILASAHDQKISNNIVAFNMSFKDPDLYNSQDSEIAKQLIKDFDVRGGILWGDNLLRIPNVVPGSDPFNYIDGPNPSANKLSQEAFAYHAISAGAQRMITGEQGDAVLGEENVKLIYDSLVKSKLYKDAYELLKSSLQHQGIKGFTKNLFNYCLFNLTSFSRNKFYNSTYWQHTRHATPNFFSDYMVNLEQNLCAASELQSLNYDFALVGHMYIFDYFFPRASYFDSMNTFMPHSHPFIDLELLKFIFSNPTHIHCDYANYLPGREYRVAKYLARSAYDGVLPDYARLKTQKTSYAGMARKIMFNSKNDLIGLIFDRKELHISEMGLVDKIKFRKSLGAALIKIDDPNNTLGLGYQFLRTAIQLEIWLCCVKGSFGSFNDLIKLRPPRELVAMEWCKE